MCHAINENEKNALILSCISNLANNLNKLNYKKNSLKNMIRTLEFYIKSNS